MKAKPQSSHIFAFAGTRTCTCKVAQLPCSWQRLLEHNHPMLSARTEKMVRARTCTWVPVNRPSHYTAVPMSSPLQCRFMGSHLQQGWGSLPHPARSVTTASTGCPAHTALYGTEKLDGGALVFMAGIGLKTPQPSLGSVPLKFITIHCFILFTSVDCVLRGVKNY